MRRAIRSVTSIVALFAAIAGAGLLAPAPLWAAGERDVTIAQGIDAEFLDVQMTNNIVTLIINGSIYDTLLTRDKQLQLVPALATSYKLVGDKVWEIKLRQGVKFHNGETFDATAVKFSFERINRADFKSPQKGWFSTIEAAEIVDPYTVRFHTKVPGPRHAGAHDPHVSAPSEVCGAGGRRAGQPQAGGDGALQVRGVGEERPDHR